MTIQYLRDAAKAVLRGKFITIQYYLKKQEKSHTIFTPKATKKMKNQKKKKKLAEEIKKTRAEINEIEIKQ